MVGGVGGQRLAPNRAQIAHFALEAEGLVRTAFGAARGGFAMQQPRMGREDHSQAARPELQAIIDIVEIDRKAVFVKAAGFHKEPPLGEQAGGGDRPAFVGDAQQVGIAGVALDAIVEGVQRREFRPEHNATVLNDPAWPQQRRAHGADIRLSNTAQHFLQPARLQGLNVIVEQQQEIAHRLRRAAVDDAREIEGAGNRQHAPPLRGDLLEKQFRLRLD